MPKLISIVKSVGDLCTKCWHRFKWSESKLGCCYWCETNSPDHPVEAPKLPLKPIPSKRW